MTKRIKNVVPDTQQEITTKVERDDDELAVEIRASTALDDDLRKKFKEQADAAATDDIAVYPRTYRSNQGNELAEDVTVRFGVDNKLRGLDVVAEIIELGKDYNTRQLERDLGSEDEEDGLHYRNQQLYFNEEEVKEFCLLYRGRVNI